MTLNNKQQLGFAGDSARFRAEVHATLEARASGPQGSRAYVWFRLKSALFAPSPHSPMSDAMLLRARMITRRKLQATPTTRKVTTSRFSGWIDRLVVHLILRNMKRDD